jgi:protein-tyrosine kinase
MADRAAHGLTGDDMYVVARALEQADRDQAVAALRRLPRTPGWRRASVDARLVSLIDPLSLAAEQYRTLRHHVEQAHRTEQLSVIAVSSPAMGDGKTTAAVNLAGALAQARDTRVLLIDADLRRPAIAARLALEDTERGLVDAIRYTSLDLSHFVRQRLPFNLWVLPSGPRMASPYELLKSPRFGELLAEARKEYDYVVLDTPPLVPVPDCQVLARHVDAFILVVAAHRTPRKVVDDALAAVSGAPVFGVIFNRDDGLVGRYGRAYATYYGADPDDTGNPVTRLLKRVERWLRSHLGSERRGRVTLVDRPALPRAGDPTEFDPEVTMQQEMPRSRP